MALFNFGLEVSSSESSTSMILVVRDFNANFLSFLAWFNVILFTSVRSGFSNGTTISFLRGLDANKDSFSKP